jgi:hypothetical protein
MKIGEAYRIQEEFKITTAAQRGSDAEAAER